MRNLNSPEAHRNMGFWNEATQVGIHDTELGLAGAGGTAYLLGLEAARIGVQRFRIADPEPFERANGNRVMGVREDTIDRNKAEVLAEDILAINPDAEITVYNEGVNPDNVEEFMHSADIVLNATELKMPNLGAMICRQARNRRINGELAPLPVLDIEYIGHAGQVTAFDPRSKMTFEKFMGIPEGMPLDEVTEQQLDPSRYLAYLPPYGDIRTLEAVRAGSALPSNMIGAGTATQLGMSEILKHVRTRVGERTLAPTFAPRVRWYDSYTGKAGETSHPRFSHYKHLALLALHNGLHLNDEASYTTEARAARGDFD